MYEETHLFPGCGVYKVCNRKAVIACTTKLLECVIALMSSISPRDGFAFKAVSNETHVSSNCVLEVQPNNNILNKKILIIIM